MKKAHKKPQNYQKKNFFENLSLKSFCFKMDDLLFGREKAFFLGLLLLKLVQL